MPRILLLIFIAWVVYQIIKRMAAGATPSTSKKVEANFVKCSHCGCHVPESESLVKNDQIICNNPECQR